MILIGIDCGFNGGMAVLQEGKPVICHPLKKLKEPKKLSDLFLYYTCIDSNLVIFIESQTLWAGEDRSRIFGIQKLVGNFTMIKNCLDIAEISYSEVHSRSWQNDLRLVIKGQKESDKDRKNRYKEAAQYYFPETKANLWNADALLIAEYGRRIEKFKPNDFKKHKPTLF
jgi:hypothetical protein